MSPVAIEYCYDTIMINMLYPILERFCEKMCGYHSNSYVNNAFPQNIKALQMAVIPLCCAGEGDNCVTQLSPFANKQRGITNDSEVISYLLH